jgi:iron complex transport system substrate-binding protein
VSPADAAGYPVTVTGTDGVSVTLTAKPRRVVSAAPSNTEILFALGLGDRVVGATEFCDYPEAAKAIPRVGGFMPKSFSAERIAGLRPDLVLTTGRVQDPLSESLRKLGLTVLSLDADTLEGVLKNVTTLGTAVGEAAAARELVTKLEARAAAVKARTDAIPVDKRPTVLLLVSEQPLLTAGPKSFPGRLVELAGGRNLFADATQDYPRVGEEEVLRRDPDALLLWSAMAGETPAARLAALRARAGWSQLKAVRAGRVLAVNEDWIARPGPRLFDALESLATQLHPTK